MSERANLLHDIAWLRDRAFMTEKGGVDIIFERIAKRLEALDAECERAWTAYRIAHDRAMANGVALVEERASGMKARSGETACGLDPKDDSAGRQASPNPTPGISGGNHGRG